MIYSNDQVSTSESNFVPASVRFKYSIPSFSSLVNITCELDGLNCSGMSELINHSH